MWFFVRTSFVFKKYTSVVLASLISSSRAIQKIRSGRSRSLIDSKRNRPIEKVFHGRNSSIFELLRADSDLSGVKSRITSFIREKVEQSQTDGVVFELNGDVNSSVIAYLCVEALGTRRVTGLMMPD